MSTMNLLGLLAGGDEELSKAAAASPTPAKQPAKSPLPPQTVPIFDIDVLHEEAKRRWLEPSEVYYILRNYKRCPIISKTPHQPSSGTLCLYDRWMNRYFRKDGHSWRSKKDETVFAEAYERLKVENVDALHCYYAHGVQNPRFQRRCFWMMEVAYEHIVLVHYREVAEVNYCAESNLRTLRAFQPTLRNMISTFAGASESRVWQVCSNAVDKSRVGVWQICSNAVDKSRLGFDSRKFANQLCSDDEDNDNDDDDDYIYLVRKQPPGSIRNDQVTVSGFDMDVILQAQMRWLETSEICSILQNHERFQTTKMTPHQPLSGALFLYDLRVNHHFKKDGHSWQMKKDGRTVREVYEQLKVGNVGVLTCYCAHGEQNPYFQRRRFRILNTPYEHIGLVHYREVSEDHLTGHQLGKQDMAIASTVNDSGEVKPTGHGKGLGLQGVKQEKLEEGPAGDDGEATKIFKRQKFDEAVPSVFSTMDSSDPRHQDSDKLAMAHLTGHQVRKQHMAIAGTVNDSGEVKPIGPGKGLGLQGLKQEKLEEGPAGDDAEATKIFKRQKFDEAVPSVFSTMDSSDLRHQDSDKLAKCLEQHSVLHEDIEAWLEMKNQWQSKRNCHQCMQQTTPLLYGIEESKKRIAEHLLLDSSSKSDGIVICIVAEGGFGKTSLLHLLYNDQQLSDAFDTMIWIHMSEKFNEIMLLAKIFEFLIHVCCTLTELNFLEEIVKEELADKKFLLVLDDAEIKNQHFWAYVRKLLNVGATGSGVVIATRSNFVARLTGALDPYYLAPLSDEEGLLVLQQHAGQGRDNPDFIKIDKLLVAKCGGNPLYLQALGGLLCHAEPCQMKKFGGKTLPFLWLCYDILPMHLKRCLAFCSLFPKDHVFEKEHIVRLWISQGFVTSAEGSELEDIGIQYFDELFCRSFFQISPLSDDKDKFVMHELIHDLVQSVSWDGYFKSDDILCSIPENVRHFSLVSSEFQTVVLNSMTKEVRDLETFLVVRPKLQHYSMCFPMTNLVGLNDLLLKFRLLKILDLSYTDIKELPSSIGELRNLRYLSLNNTSINSLPSEICRVSSLQTLEVKDCRFLTELPDNVKSLVKLRHLDVRKEFGYVRMPPGIGQLSDLQTLPLFNVEDDLLHCSVSELGYLQGLRASLHIAGLENIRQGEQAQEANLKDKRHLQILTLEWHDHSVDTEGDEEQTVTEQVLEGLQPHTNLQELVVRNYAGYEFPTWMQDSCLSNLVSITLDNCYNCSQLPALGELPSLKFLCIRKMYGLQKLGNGMRQVKFQSLELLKIWEMYELEELFEVGAGDFPLLRSICISRCPNLRNLPCIPSLVDLSLHCCHQLPDIPELPSLELLKIEGFHNVESLSLPPRFPALKRLEISHCKELSSVDGLQGLTSVEKLRIVKCPELDLAKNLQKCYFKRISTTMYVLSFQ